MTSCSRITPYTSILDLPQTTTVGNGDLFIVQQGTSTFVIDYENIIFSLDNMDFAGAFDKHTTDILALSSTISLTNVGTLNNAFNQLSTSLVTTVKNITSNVVLNFNASALGSIFNVFAYGAKGDGVQDDYPGIQSAVRALTSNGGGVLYFPEGTYRVNTTIALYNNNISFTIRGDGSNSHIKSFITSNTIIPGTTEGVTGTPLLYFYRNTGRLILENLKLEGGAAEQVNLQAPCIHADNSSNIYLRTLELHSGYRGSCSFRSCSSINVLNCKFTTSIPTDLSSHAHIGVRPNLASLTGHKERTYNINIDSCYFENYTRSCIALQNYTSAPIIGFNVNNCLFYNNSSTFFAIEGTNLESPAGDGRDSLARNFRITGNTFSNVGKNGGNGVSVTCCDSIINNNTWTSNLPDAILQDSSRSGIEASGQNITIADNQLTHNGQIMFAPDQTNFTGLSTLNLKIDNNLIVSRNAFGSGSTASIHIKRGNTNIIHMNRGKNVDITNNRISFFNSKFRDGDFESNYNAIKIAHPLENVNITGNYIQGSAILPLSGTALNNPQGGTGIQIADNNLTDIYKNININNNTFTRLWWAIEIQTNLHSTLCSYPIFITNNIFNEIVAPPNYNQKQERATSAIKFRLPVTNSILLSSSTSSYSYLASLSSDKPTTATQPVQKLFKAGDTLVFDGPFQPKVYFTIQAINSVYDDVSRTIYNVTLNRPLTIATPTRMYVPPTISYPIIIKDNYFNINDTLSGAPLSATAPVKSSIVDSSYAKWEQCCVSFEVVLSGSQTSLGPIIPSNSIVRGITVTTLAIPRQSVPTSSSPNPTISRYNILFSSTGDVGGSTVVYAGSSAQQPLTADKVIIPPQTLNETPIYVIVGKSGTEPDAVWGRYAITFFYDRFTPPSPLFFN